MNVLIACETSGVVREAFRAKGHNAWSCDLDPADDDSLSHYQGDIFNIFDNEAVLQPWDLMIAFPPCQFLSNSGVHLLKKEAGRWEKMIQGAKFFKKLWEAKIKKKAFENPVMHGYGKKIIGFKKFTQFIQPYDFGEDASKKTGLLLENLPPLIGTLYIPPKLKKGRWVWGNQTPSGQNKLGPSKDRGKIRARTYQGIADAMADQWG